MIGAYDEWGNVVDLVKWEEQIRAEERVKLAYEFNDGFQNGKAEAIEELKPFFDECEEFVFDWICDDLCGEFINPDTDESWCAEHCHNGTGYECIKKWCELKQTKGQKNDNDRRRDG